MGGAVVVPSIAMLTLLRPAKAVCLLGSAVNTEIIEVVTIITITRDLLRATKPG